MARAITRRTSLKHLALFASGAATGWWPRLSFASDDEPTPSEDELDAIAAIATSFMRLYDVPALSIAIARHGQFVYRKAFGFADKGENEIATPANLFRIASISKPITSVTIFTLIEAGRISLSDRVFGPQGILGFDYATKYPDLVQEITIDHLLTHTSGGWSSYENDPTFFDPKASAAETITWYIRNDPLRYPPGQHFAYSNLGYGILGCVVEKVTRQSYPQYVQQNVFARCGMSGARVMGNTRAERAPREVIYYGETDRAGGWTHPYAMNLNRFVSTGGWLATATDLVRFAMHVDGFEYTPNILSRQTIETMTSPCAVSPIPHYARGWYVNELPNWWHGGRLPGSMNELVRTASGLCWCALANTHTDGIDEGMDKMLSDIVNAVPEWHAIPAPVRPQP
ncbi:MAG TPA: serine hydrolase domain-containing protein [Candidatus Binataceae bacterium]|nr:serine hydrolase domain-containing protein [Candidatus Binataceae bacterium]